MSLEFFLTNQAQITITMIPMFLCSYAKQKATTKKTKKQQQQQQQKKTCRPLCF